MWICGLWYLFLNKYNVDEIEFEAACSRGDDDNDYDKKYDGNDDDDYDDDDETDEVHLICKYDNVRMGVDYGYPIFASMWP